MKNLLEFGHAGDRSRANLVSQGLERRDLQHSLNLVDWLSARRHADSKTVVGQSSKAVVVNGFVHVGVVVVVVGDIPV